ncbi:MAG: TIGR01777 family oxidoreductase [Acidimicrobiales bacterium]|nr:TIGR01777 family oxidoreductase [Acidimicrobiales bacterium]
MIIAVTGSSGMIGSALCKSLESSGHEVIRISRNPDDEIFWNPADGVIDEKSLDGVNAVIHLAGENIASRRWSNKQKSLIYESRVKGTQLLAKTLATLPSPPEVLLSGSAIGFYGDCGDTPVDETSPQGGGFLASVCADWENATKPAEDAGIRVVHLRTGIVLDPFNGMLEKVLPLFKLGLGGRLGKGNQYWSWIGLEDEIRLITWLLSEEISGPVNLTAPEPVTNAVFTKALGSTLRKPTVFSVPRFGPRLLIGQELAKELIFTSTRAIPRVAQTNGFQFNLPQIDSGLKKILD